MLGLGTEPRLVAIMSIHSIRRRLRMGVPKDAVHFEVYSL